MQQEQQAEVSPGSRENLNLGFSFLDSIHLPEVEAPTESSQESCYYWDNYRENPSFVEPNTDPSVSREDLEKERHPVAISTPRRQSSTDNQFLDIQVQSIEPFIFSSYASNPVTVWPPRHPSSESDLSFEAHFLPTGLLDVVDEIAEEDVFEASEESEENQSKTMPPKPKTPAELFKDFKKAVGKFNRTKELALSLEGVINDEVMTELRGYYKDVQKLEELLEDADPTLADYPQLVEDGKRVQAEWHRVLQHNSGAGTKEPPAGAVEVNETATVKQQTDKAIAGLNAEMEGWEAEINQINADMMELFSQKPTPDKVYVQLVSVQLEKLGKAVEAARAIYIQQSREVSGYEDMEQRTNIKATILANWKAIQTQTGLLVTKGREYNCKFDNTSVPTVQQPPAAAPGHSAPRSIQLERLPLPTFGGKKMEYLRFKQEFDKHVKYETEEQKILALKTKCLLKNSDKQRIANEDTLASC